MAVGKEHICRICKQILDTEALQEGVDWVQPQPKWYYHTSCYNDYAKTAKKLLEKDLDIEMEATWWLDAVWQYFKKERHVLLDFKKLKSQWENFIKKGYTPKGIYFSVRYFYEVQNGDISKAKGGIGIVPFIYNEATAYWARRDIEDKDLVKRIENQVKSMVIVEPRIHFQKMVMARKKQAVDLSEI